MFYCVPSFLFASEKFHRPEHRVIEDRPRHGFCLIPIRSANRVVNRPADAGEGGAPKEKEIFNHRL